MDVEQDLTNTDIVMNRMLWITTYPFPVRPTLDYPMEPIGEVLPEAGR